MQNCNSIEPVSNYSIAINAEGKIAKVGPSQDVEQWIQKEQV
jgi:hypothetical protein